MNHLAKKSVLVYIFNIGCCRSHLSAFVPFFLYPSGNTIKIFSFLANATNLEVPFIDFMPFPPEPCKTKIKLEFVLLADG